MRRYLYFFIFLFPFSCFSTMTIKAESASLNKEKGLLILKGNVVLKKDAITLKASIVKLKGGIENPEEIIASGNVIVFDRDRDATIKAEVIEVLLKEKKAYCRERVEISYKNKMLFGNFGSYEGKKNIAELKGSCTMKEEGRCFSSEVMRYFIDEELIEFEGNVKGVLTK